MKKYAFLLGREPELSLAELRSIFTEVTQEGTFAIVSTEKDVQKYAHGLGGTIKIAEIMGENLKREELLKKAIEIVEGKAEEGKKLRIALDSFVPALAMMVFKIKDALKKTGRSIRVVQHDNDGRVKNATTIHEKLLSQGCELMAFATRNGYTLAQTVWIQDIEGYSERDIGRERSMTVGMMPPKLAQIMINLATKGDTEKKIWDPFCGLGTTLIEAIHAGYNALIGSDLSEDMVQTTKKNTEKAQHVKIEIKKQDARKLDTYTLDTGAMIVTEGMLGKNFTAATINTKTAIEERTVLSSLYRDFFASAYKNKNVSTIACCLPYWNIGTDAIYMPDLTQIAGDWSVDPVCLSSKRYLRHFRPGQCVGREIVVLRRK